MFAKNVLSIFLALGYRYSLQYSLANPNRGVPIFKKSVPISEFVQISEVTLFLWSCISKDTLLQGHSINTNHCLYYVQVVK